MTPRKDRSADDTFDRLISEHEPTPVETKGPSTGTFTDDQDLLDGPRALAGVEGIGPATLAKATADDDLVRTVRGAIEWGFGQLKARVAIYTGLCLMFVRLCFNVDPLAPDAITAWENSARKRRCTPAEARRGHAGFFRGGTHGHVVLCLGNGRCLTNDTGKPGTINVAMIRDIERAWGYVFLGDVDELNGERAPRPKEPTRRRVTDKVWRRRYLRRAIGRARQAGDARRVARLRRWIQSL